MRGVRPAPQHGAPGRATRNPLVCGRFDPPPPLALQQADGGAPYPLKASWNRFTPGCRSPGRPGRTLPVRPGSPRACTPCGPVVPARYAP